ncbi:uncharacterized protein LOC103308981 [Acyrthosiphon pisum]|uniref:Uncharacterized protein n=1 Tax=Acyrthosiphon pisum TaxID=7029 RepID=A0A8R2H6Z2_ACYPI|nr:uncharacterized protein LOC103308981 [Acyrthosiphon pisum]|eukprot:XP_016658747.1 PREDICTED: uncharacterized protein LOC103308981 [Acyrthosiphon pisum]
MTAAHYLTVSKLELESVTLDIIEHGEHHASDNIRDWWFNDVLNACGIIKDQICSVVTDSGNFVVQNALDNNQNIASIIIKIKSLVKCFKQPKQSESAMDELHKICEYKLKQSVPTRRNSVYFMLNRFIICSENIASAIVKVPKGSPMSSGSELFAGKEIISLLKPFDAATKELYGQEYVTDFKSSLTQNLIAWFGKVEYLEILSIATILDPRFKTLYFNGPIDCYRAIDTIQKNNFRS